MAKARSKKAIQSENIPQQNVGLLNGHNSKQNSKDIKNKPEKEKEKPVKSLKRKVKDVERDAGNEKVKKRARVAKVTPKTEEHEEEDCGFRFTRARAKKALNSGSNPKNDKRDPQMTQLDTSKRVNPIDERNDVVEKEMESDRPVERGEKNQNNELKLKSNEANRRSEQVEPNISKAARPSLIKSLSSNTATRLTCLPIVPRRPVVIDGPKYVSSTLGGKTIDIEIPLPTSETPMIRKNKEMRNSNRRRSSFSLRGRRAESLSGGAFVLPHPDIESHDYHMHISAELPDPVRMKQLLLWCGKKSMDEMKQAKYIKSSSQPGKKIKVDVKALEIAKSIKNELLKALASNKINTSWYHQTTNSVVEQPIEKKENPRNVANRERIKYYEERLQRFKTEEESWTSLLRRISSLHASVIDSLTTSSSSSSAALNVGKDNIIHQTMLEALTEEEKNVWRLCGGNEANSTNMDESKSISTTESNSNNLDELRQKVSGVEFDITNLFHTIYHLTQYNSSAQEYTDRALTGIHRYMDDKYLNGGNSSDINSRIEDGKQLLKMLSETSNA